MSQLALSGRTLLPDGTLQAATVVVERGAITRVTPGLDSKADLVVPGILAPGFIELQLNGAYGADFSSDGYSVASVAARLPETGVTAFLPTIITSPWETYPKRLSQVREAMRATRGATGAQPLGVHLEGPYLHPAKRGAHNQAFLRAPNVDEILRWAEDSLIVTLAPELPGALMSSSIPCGLIADGIHVHPAMVKLAFRAKSAEGITLVTDAMAAMGMAPGRYKSSDRDVSVDQTAARLEDGTLAGSILKMDQAVLNVIEFTGCTLAEALTMASTTPARVLSLDRKGRIEIGRAHV
jgi:N-acetylglucosamine-6-phosphate deacetylase